MWGYIIALYCHPGRDRPNFFIPDKESAVRAKHKGIFILFVLRVFMDVPGHEFTRGRNRIFKKCKLEVVGGCLCWRVESSDVVIPDNDKIRF